MDEKTKAALKRVIKWMESELEAQKEQHSPWCHTDSCTAYEETLQYLHKLFASG